MTNETTKENPLHILKPPRYNRIRFDKNFRDFMKRHKGFDFNLTPKIKWQKGDV
jgi:hypothetical protein